MDWHADIRSELARHGRRVDDDVVEEMAQHAEFAWHAARAEGTAKEAATVRARDPVAFGATVAVFVAVGFVAAYLPARRASRVEPTTVMREG
jgi:ABC-type lipoprotein release transport system permease subunit